MKNWYTFSMYVSIGAPLLILATLLLNHVYLRTYKTMHTFHLLIRKNERVHKDKCIYIIVLLAMVAFTASVSNLMYILAGHQGSIINNTYNLLQFILLSAFYHYLHEDGAAFRKKKIAHIGVVVYVVLAGTYLFKTGTFQQYQVQTRLVGNLILVVYSIYTFFSLRGGPLVDDRQMSVLGDDMYRTIVKIVSAPVWFNVGVLVYFGGSLIITLIETYIQPQLFSNPVYVEQAYTIWIIHNLLNIIKNLLFAIGIYYAGKYGMARRLKLAPGRYVPLEAN